MSRENLVLAVGVFNVPPDEEFLREAKKKGKRLIVGVLSDCLSKVSFPEGYIYPVSERMEALRKFPSVVAFVFELGGEKAYDVIQRLSPSILAIPAIARSDPNFGEEQMVQRLRIAPGVEDIEIVVL